jgi:hypothetical protein
LIIHYRTLYPSEILHEKGATIMAYADDREWEKQTMPILVSELQDYYKGRITTAGEIDDRDHGTDMFWRRALGNFRLACRIRKPGFMKYRGDFTIREDRPRTGYATELEKIRKGDWADFYVYGFCDGHQMLHWSIFRMSEFNPEAPFQYMPGFGPRDGQDTVTRIYRIQDQPKSFLIDAVTTDAGKRFLACQNQAAA